MKKLMAWSGAFVMASLILFGAICSLAVDSGPKSAEALFESADYVAHIHVSHTPYFDSELIRWRNEASGSGFIVEGNRVKTVAHLFPKGYSFSAIITFKNGQDATVDEACIEMINYGADRAILKLPANFKFTGKYARIARTTPKTGQVVFAISSPAPFNRNKLFTISRGEIVAMATMADVMPAYHLGNDLGVCIFHTAPTNFGSSGSPLVNEYGEVAGINSAKTELVEAYKGIALIETR